MHELLDHQQEALSFLTDNYHRHQGLGLVMDPGLGKSRIILEEIKTLPVLAYILIVGPAISMDVWANEIEKWLGPEYTFYPLKPSTRQITRKLEHHCGQRLYFCTLESLSRSNALTEALAYETADLSYLVLDESTYIKSPRAARTKFVLKRLAPLFDKRRILTGTFLTNSPFDAYTQMSFLEPGCFTQRSYYSFKHYYGIWRFRQMGEHIGFEELVEHRNKEELMARIKPFIFVKKKEDVGIAFPEKIYRPVYYELCKEQREKYKEVRHGILEDCGMMKILESMSKLVNLHYICSGYTENNTELVPIKANPKLKKFKEILNTHDGDRFIVWCKWIRDAHLVEQFLEKNEHKYFSMYGNKDRKSLEEFNDLDNNYRFLVITTKKGGFSLTIPNIDCAVYFSNEYSVETREQSENRCHRLNDIGTANVIYYDLIGQRTVEENLYIGVKEKRDLNVKLLEWLK